MPKLNNLFVSKSCSRFCAIDSQISFLAFAIASKKSKIVSKTHTNWSQFGTVSETWGLANRIHSMFDLKKRMVLLIKVCRPFVSRSEMEEVAVARARWDHRAVTEVRTQSESKSNISSSNNNNYSNSTFNNNSNNIFNNSSSRSSNNIIILRQLSSMVR